MLIRIRIKLRTEGAAMLSRASFRTSSVSLYDESKLSEKIEFIFVLRIIHLLCQDHHVISVPNFCFVTTLMYDFVQSGRTVLISPI